MIFDLDGTLIDSRPGVVASIEYALRETGFSIPDSGLAPLIGPPLDVMVAELLPNAAYDVRADFIQRFRAHYDQTGYKASEPYPGVHSALEEMRECGFRLHVLTNKRQRPAEMIVYRHGWADLISSVAGVEDELAADTQGTSVSKPIRGAALIANLGQTSTVIVGDGVDDLATAQHIGGFFLLAEWGYGVGEVLAVNPGVTRVRSFPDVPRAVIGLFSTF